MKLHWFAYSFASGTYQGSCYVGHPDKLITLPRLLEAKSAANMASTSVLISVCYMGYATKEEITGETDGNN